MRGGPRLAIFGLVLSFAAYLVFLARHLHNPAASESRLQSLLRSQAAEISRLKQQLTRVHESVVPLPCAKTASPSPPAPTAAAAESVVAVKAASDKAAAAATATTPAAVPAAAFSVDASENFMLATRQDVASATAAADPVRVLRGVLGVALLLRRTVILPPGAPSDALLASPRLVAELNQLGVRMRPASFLSVVIASSEELKCSHVRVETPHGLDSEQFAHALRHYSTTRIVEFDAPHESYCGVSVRADAKLIDAEKALDRAVREAAGGGGAAALLGRCFHSIREEEVSQYWDLGKCTGHRVRVALPDSITRLPAGSDLMVTFSTGGVATMAHNWVAALRQAGVREGVLIGALDAKMVSECERRGLPCVSVAGDNSTTKQLSQCKEQVGDLPVSHRYLPVSLRDLLESHRDLDAISPLLDAIFPHLAEISPPPLTPSARLVAAAEYSNVSTAVPQDVDSKGAASTRRTPLKTSTLLSLRPRG